MRWVLIGLLRVYRAVVSPLYGPVCRYHPSCSAYALDAVTRHGAVRGGWLAVRRVARCNPWSWGGYDPVPGADPEHDAERAGSGRAPHTPPAARPVPVRDDGTDAPEHDTAGPVPFPDRESSRPAPTREARH